MPKSIYPSVDEMTNLKTRDRKRKSKTLKSDSEKRLDALRTISKMIELLDQFEKEWNKSGTDNMLQTLGNTLFSQQKEWLNRIKKDLT